MADAAQDQPHQPAANNLDLGPAVQDSAAAHSSTPPRAGQGSAPAAGSAAPPAGDKVDDRSRTPSPPSMRPSPAPVGAPEGSSTAEPGETAHEPAGNASAPSASPSTPTRLQPSSPSSSAAAPTELFESSEQHDQQHIGSSPVSVDAAHSSPASARTASSPSSTASQSPSGPPPSRRVKVYRLKDDAWIDLGTGTCSGEFISSSAAQGNDAEGDARMGSSSDDEEGAWIVVRRERVRRDRGQDSPTGKKSKGRDEDDESGSPTEGKSPSKGGAGRQLVEGGADDDDELDEGPPILKTRVQPYPPGYLPEDLLDDEEMTSVDDNGNTTVDAGGYQRQQDTLIVWTERTATEGDEEQEMALSFATPSGCGEMWEFIKAARRFAGASLPLPSRRDPLELY